MTSLIFPSGNTDDLFKDFKPSTKAHVDFLSSNSTDVAGSGTRKVKLVKLTLKQKPTQSTSKELLSIILPSIPLILAGKPTSTTASFHHLSSACHRLVLPPHNLGPTIYTSVNEEIQKSVQGLAREWRGSIMGREAGWLERLQQGWKEWEGRVSILSAVLVYLDRMYSNESTGIASIRELAISSFRKGIWENELMFQKTRDDYLQWASDERQAGTANTDLRPTIIAITQLSKLLSTFSSLSSPYLENITAYYCSQATSKIDSISNEVSPTGYVEWALEKVEEERQRCLECLDEIVAEEAVDIVRRETGTNMQDKIIGQALDEAMKLADSQALSRLYRFSTDVQVFPAFTKALQEYIHTRLKTLISDPANDPRMIDETLKLKRFTDDSISALFSTKVSKQAVQPGSEVAPKPQDDLDDEDMEVTDKQAARPADDLDMEKEEEEDIPLSGEARTRQLELQDSIRTGFKAGMGSRQNAPAEWIAKHLDQVMRKGQGSGTESAFNSLLDEIIALIGFTRDKDVFKAFYSTQLAKRLLLNKSASDDMERNMIIKLQKEMGEEFTTGDVMMKDLGLSETLVKTYQAHISKSSSLDPTNLSANVLTESAWPAYPLLKDGWAFKLTPELQGSVDEFTKWYATQHKNRQLSWRWQLATVTLTGRFGVGKYEIGVSLFQAVVLLGFNEVDELDFKEIKERTGIETSELIRTLQSLSLGRKGTRVLLKKPLSKEVLPTDIFKYNKSFTSDRIKFKINQIQQDLSAEESKKTNEQVAIDRVSVLEATIVRIMKGRKKLMMVQLIDGVVGDVSKRFPPDVKEIKKRVESLIEREFLMRDEDDRNLLHYLA